MGDFIVFKVNGEEYQVGCEVSSDVSLLDFLREDLELRGTKYMCREAGCGACVVSVNRANQQPYAVNSCMVSITSCHGLEITTIEGLGNKKKGYHILQTTLAGNNGTQCGHCSPGWVMAMYSLLKSKKKQDLTMLEVESSLSSNVCRCTGYRPILEAFKKFAVDAPAADQIIDIEDLNICTAVGKGHCNDKDDDWCLVNKCDVEVNGKICIKLRDGKYWYRVEKVGDVFEILDKNGDDDYMLVAGNTAKGAYPIEKYPQILIDINGISELKGYKLDQNLIIGAGTTLTELLNILQKVSKIEYFGYLQNVYDHLQKVAHVPVRNIGTVAGNLMIKHQHNVFSSDIFLLLETVGAQLTLVRRNYVKQTVTMQQFLKTNMRGVVILDVMLPPLSNEHKLVTFKIMPRRLNAHAIINAGFLFQLSKNDIVQRSRIVFGGLSPTFSRAYKTEEFLVRKCPFLNETLQLALKVLDDELVVTEEPPEPSVEYRRKTALALFYKALLVLCPADKIHPRYRSGAIKLHDTRPVSQAKQTYKTDPSMYPLTQPIPKIDGLYQCAGEAFYSDDLPSHPRDVFAAFTLTTVGSGYIVSIDPCNALKQPGVIAWYSAKDIPGINGFVPDTDSTPVREEIFCSGAVKFYNQPFGVIVAETRAIAERAAKLVKVEYRDVKTPVTDVKDALQDPKRITLYRIIDATNTGDDVETVIKGSNTIYSQYHFTMENIVCVVHPIEEGLKVYTSTHYIDGTHIMMSKALQLDQSRIDIHVRRVGGSYGLKISRGAQSAIACALVAKKLNRPCRFVQSLTSTTRAVGKRRPCANNFQVGVNHKGVIQYINTSMYQDEGHVVNELIPALVLSNSYWNCYDQSKWNFKLYSTVTDTPKNSWFRAPGSLEGVSHAELIMEQISYELSLDPIEVRLNNLDRKKYKDIEQMYDTLKSKASYDARKVTVNQFNKDNRWKKRGLRASFARWSMGPFGNFNVILSVYQGDGTVAIAHGGIELGQGSNTKAAQICAYLLKIPIEKIQIKGANTVANPNSDQAAASIASQNVAVGVQICCEKILERLQPFREEKPSASWEEIVAEAYVAGVNLQAQSHINVQDSERYPYDVFGVAMAEVEIDVLTGESEILRVDVLQDAGKPVSPQIDIGQTEGAFIMGVGYWTSEKLTYAKTGELLTNRTWNYHIPLSTDIPQDFRVHFREQSFSYKAIFGAKGIGEAPLLLAICVPLAIREAISEARYESGIPRNQWFCIDGPSTVDVIALSTATNTKDFRFN